MTTKIDIHLHTLGLARGASTPDIVLAYRKLALKHHPDKGGKEEDFKRVKAAYEWLDANYEKELALERTVKKENSSQQVMWSSFSDKPNPNIVRPTQQSYVRKPYEYPSNIPKWNEATTLENDWEVARYEQSGELDRQMFGDFLDWNKPKKEEKNQSTKKADFWSNYKT